MIVQRHLLRAVRGLRAFRALCAAILIAVLPAPTIADTPVRQASATQFKLGVLAFRSKPDTLARWQPLADYLTLSVSGTQFTVEAYTYPELDAAVTAKEVDFILTQPAHYIQLTYRQHLSSPLATLIEADGGNALDSFGGVIFTRADRQDLAELADLRGKRLAASAVSSLGSYQMQAFTLAQAGIHLPQDAHVEETGQPQDKAVQAVLAGRADAGFVRTGVIEAMAREGKLEAAQLKIINPRRVPGFPFQLSTTLYPEWPVVALVGVKQDVARRVAAALLSLPQDGEITRALRIHGFAIPGDYRAVDDLLRELRLPPFDAVPAFTLHDVWQRHQGEMAVLALAGILLLLLVIVMLVRNNKYLRIERARVRDSLAQLSASQAQLRKLSQAVEQSPASVIITDLESRIEYVNQAFVRTTGYEPHEIIGKNPNIMQTGKTAGTTYQALWASLNAGQVWQGEFVNRRKDGSEFVESAIIAPVRDESNRITHYLAVKQDISDKINAEAEIHRLAYYDALTGLPNRTLFVEQLEQSLAVGKRRKRLDLLILFNIDRFKTLNDARGHQMGDLLLMAVGGRLAGLTREGDTLARLAGDEFVLLIQDIAQEQKQSSRQALVVAEKIHASLRLPFMFGEEEATITATLGITFFPQSPDDTPQDVLKRAQTALHRAKESGGNQIAFFDTTMGDLAQQRFLIERELRHGIPAEELRLFLQSQVNAAGRVVGAEALVRWQHPQRGLLPPSVFISVAEESDLIIDLETWVFSEACRLMAEQEMIGHSLQMAVNISPRHFRQRGFVAWLKDLLAAYGVDASRLTLEVTEGMVIDNVSDVVAKMTELATLGIHFAIDDFGTGYSSLSYLKRMPIHELKIDKSFVQDLPADANDAALVETILSIAEHLHLHVVAEGVETQAQAEFLTHRTSLVTLQGYLFGRPEPASEWLTRWHSGLN